MGLRGPGARKKPAPAKKRRFPWKNKKLSRAERVIAFLEWLPITKGILAGTKMKLLPEQREWVQATYGNDVHLSIFSEPRGNGKTGLASGLALCHLLGPESESRGEIYSAAIDRQQAAVLFAEMEAIIFAVPEFEACTNIIRFHKRIEVTEGDGRGSIYEALSADARRAHGLAPTLWIYDELAQAKDRELLDNLRTAQGKRNRSLGIIISTQAPRDDHPLSELIDDGLKAVDPGIHVTLISAPRDAEPFDPNVIRACNPAIDKFLDFQELLRQAEQARRMPSFESKFRNLRLNQRVAQDAGLVSETTWKSCGRAPWDEAFQSGTVRIGLDLSARNDLTALITVARWKDEWHVKSDFFTPAEGIEERAKRDRAPYDIWARDGLIHACPGASVEYEAVATRLIEICDDYTVKEVVFDRWRMDVLQEWLTKAGVKLPLVPFGQGFKSMAPALDIVESAIMNGKVRHGNHPVLTMCAVNCRVDMDAAGNRKFNKAKSYGRIDGMVALAMAMGIEQQTEPEPTYQAFSLGS